MTRSAASHCFVPIVAALVLLPATLIPAAPPAVDYLFPAGAQQGSTTTITVGSTKDARISPRPAAGWADHPGISFKPAGAEGAFAVSVGSDVPAGPHLVRIYNADGCSAPRLFTVGRQREEIETEPNDEPRKAQAIERLPATMNGRLDKGGDVDCFSITASAGQWIVAELECRRLGSPVDPALHLLDPDGTEIAFNHDTFGLDPLIACRAPRTGNYVIQVVGFAHPPAADVRFTGARNAVYRLYVTNGPYARYAFPCGARRGSKTPVHLFGWNLPRPSDSFTYEVDAANVPPRTEDLFVSPPGIGNALRLSVGDSPEIVEDESNDNAYRAAPVSIPSVINGRIGHRGEIDRFAFAAKKGDRLNFRVRSASLWFPLDAVLTIEDAGGAQIARADDSGQTQEPALEWTAPADGTFTATVSDLNRAGGDNYVYRLEISRPAPSYTATVDVPSVGLQPGKSAELKVTVTRRAGHAAPLAVAVADLPEGITAAAPAVPAAGGQLGVTLSAAATAQPTNRPVRILVLSTDESRPEARHATFTPMADSMVPPTDVLWLTVTALRP